MATVVGLKQEKSETIAAKKYQYVDIVDGQQRITTLIILYKAICEELYETGEEKQVKQDLQATLVKHGGQVLLLQTNHDTGHHFANYIRDGSCVPPDQAKTSADRNILEAIDDCKKFVKKWKDGKHSIRIKDPDKFSKKLLPIAGKIDIVCIIRTHVLRSNLYTNILVVIQLYLTPFFNII